MPRLNFQVITQLQELQSQGQSMFLSELVDSFIQTTSERLELLNRALLQKDYELIKTTTHSLKSSSGTLGSEKMFLICSNIEAAISSNRFFYLLALFNELTSEYETTLPELIKLKKSK